LITKLLTIEKRDIVTGTTVEGSTHPLIVYAYQSPSMFRVETTKDHLIISAACDPRVRRRLNVRTFRCTKYSTA